MYKKKNLSNKSIHEMAGWTWSATKWMDGLGILAVIGFLVLGSSLCVSAARISKEQEASRYVNGTEELVEPNFVSRASGFFWQPGRVGYKHVWPVSSSFIHIVPDGLLCFVFVISCELIFYIFCWLLDL